MPKGSPLDQTVINRITIGKTKLANSFGKYIGPLPHNINCYSCNTPEDLHHIFNSCINTTKERRDFKHKQLNIGAPFTYPEILLGTNPNELATHQNIIKFIIDIGKIGKI